jgi:[ribosomal protein S18]-alanine N-acetyltransferase
MGDDVVNAWSLEIRRPELAEMPELAALDKNIFGENCYNALVLRQFYDLAGQLLLVAAENASLIGYSIVLPSVVRGEGWFMALGVLSSHRRKSIGRSLAKATMYEAKLAGINSLRLTVERNNYPAQHLYRELGFFAEADEENYLGAGEHRIVMRNHAISAYLRNES